MMRPPSGGGAWIVMGQRIEDRRPEV